MTTYSYQHNHRSGTTTLYRNEENYTRTVLGVLGTLEDDEEVLLELIAEIDYHSAALALLRQKVSLLRKLREM